MTVIAKQDIELEQKYRDWRESPLWYCVKTIYHNSGKIESEIVKDEKTRLPITIQSFDKPSDGAYETANATVYYTYYRGYEEAKRQMKAMQI